MCDIKYEDKEVTKTVIVTLPDGKIQTTEKITTTRKKIKIDCTLESCEDSTNYRP